ncbi:MAG: NAD(+) diphosphatase [Calditrichaceae bacterium]|nr:NAD(+) diphosphatase [Calditrichaceae bacterium]
MKKNSFSPHFIDKASAERINQDWIDGQLKKSSTKIIPIWQTKVLCKKDDYQQPVKLTIKDYKKKSPQSDRFVFLGLINGEACFTHQISSEEVAAQLCQKNSSEFLDFRKAAPLLSYEDYALLAMARFMVNWNSRHAYCGKCGHKTNTQEGGNVRICSNESCKENFYPSMDPAVIVLVTDGDKCLLGRQSPWPKNMYSTLAGFVEPGESIEHAVYREVEEETGIQVDNIKYQSSQPWLFPSSLMLGFNASAINNNITLNKSELDDARWYTRKEIKEQLEKGLIKMPMSVSIAYSLIKNWYEQGELGNLDNAIP